MSYKTDFVTVPSSIPEKATIVKTFFTGHENFEVNDQLYIIGYPASIYRQYEIIIGDRVSKINGIQMKTKTEVTTALSVRGEFTLELYRRNFAKPVPREIWARVMPYGTPGSGYFVVECVKLPTDTGTSFGFSLSGVKDRAFVTSVEPNSIAARYFDIGDALIDVDGVPIPFNANSDFFKKYSTKFFNSGSFAVIVERAAGNNAREMVNHVMEFMTSAPIKCVEVEAAKKPTA